MSFYFASEKNRRTENEDSYCQIDLRINHEAALHIAAVADGMGGLSNGKLYSQTAINLWYEKLFHLMMDNEFKNHSLSRQMEVLKRFCESIYEQINQELYRMGLDQGVRGGTTLTTAIHFWDIWIISNCGDSPVYSVKDGIVTLRSVIQNQAWRMVDQGETTVGSVSFYQHKNRLEQYLGRREPVTPYVGTIPDGEVEALLLATDGAIGEYDEARLSNLFLTGIMDGQRLLKDLFDGVKSSGEEDNQTAVLYMTDYLKEETTGDPWSLPEIGVGQPEGETCEYHAVRNEPRGVGRKIRDWFKAGHR